MKEAETRMLIWICGYTRNYEIKNKVIQDKIGVAVLVHKMREAG